jgi:predicted transcriptional regulator
MAQRADTNAITKTLEGQGFTAVEFANNAEANEAGNYRIMATKDGRREKYTVDGNGNIVTV